ncbi:MAG: PaaI family thioesterase [Chloroflexota bacterium]
MKRQLPYHGWCFVCGNENPHSIGVTWWVDDDGIMTSEFTLNDAQQGPPGHAHGGASAAILDEAMGLVVWAAGHKVAAVNLEINYHKPLPLHQPLKLEARITQMDERKIFSTGEIRLPDGTVAVSGRGIYVVAPQLFDKVELQRQKEMRGE